MKNISLRLYRHHGYASPTDYAHKCIIPYTPKAWDLYCQTRPADLIISRVWNETFLDINRRFNLEMFSM